MKNGRELRGKHSAYCIYTDNKRHCPVYEDGKRLNDGGYWKFMDVDCGEKLLIDIVKHHGVLVETKLSSEEQVGQGLKATNR